MAELSNLESKLGEVVGLAMAAQEAGDKVAKLAKEGGDDELVATLERMVQQAKETQERGTEVASSFEGKKTAILEEARDVKGKAQQMMKTYLDGASDTLDGFEFLTMAEAGEVGHWEILGTLSERAGNSDVSQLVGWALPIQQQHLETVRSTSLKLAAEEDPNEPVEEGGEPLTRRRVNPWTPSPPSTGRGACAVPAVSCRPCPGCVSTYGDQSARRQSAGFPASVSMS